LFVILLSPLFSWDSNGIRRQSPSKWENAATVPERIFAGNNPFSTTYPAMSNGELPSVDTLPAAGAGEIRMITGRDQNESITPAAERRVSTVGQVFQPDSE
jgi:hypothetical protein